YGHAAENLDADTELVVFSSAVPKDNPERIKASELKIPELTYAEFLGELSRTKRTIAICGCHGKSTTTAMIGRILEAAGLDPLVIVGSLIPGFVDGNLRMGRGEWFVVEACEHYRHFLSITPEIVVVTNIDRDHLDYYKDLDDIKNAFEEFMGRAKLVIGSGDDLNSKKLLQKFKAKTVAIEGPGDYQVIRGESKNGKQVFQLNFHDPSASVGVTTKIELQLPGRHNVYDAALAFAAATEIGIEPKASAASLGSYAGIWRRFEKVGEVMGAPIYSDYAHHPMEIRVTLEAAREFYPEADLIVGFQPHQHNRTKELFNDFVGAFELADEVVIAEIFDVAGREEKDIGVSSATLIKAINKHNQTKGIKQTAEYVKTVDDLEAALRAKLERPSDCQKVVFVLGAGDVDKAARNLAEV
ncbi:MAG: UDP-N-acetylmuramate--L-alanine ligase, partial [bacterium]